VSPKRPSSLADRDVLVPKHPTPAAGVPVPSAPVNIDWREETTGVHTDAQVFRAVKKLGDELEANKREAAKAHGALKQELHEMATKVDQRFEAFDTRLTKQDLVLERMAGQLDVLVPMKRSRPDSAEIHKAVDKALETSGTKFRRDLILKIVGGAIALVTSGAFIGWMVS
jgi:LmbE family N-acetylglucosaminyl deacetylase